MARSSASTFAISAGKLDELKQATKEIVEFVGTNEPQVLMYAVYISDDGKQMTGIQMHPDSESIATHFEVAGPHFGKIVSCLEAGSAMHVYGAPSDDIRNQMQAMAAGMGVTLSFEQLSAGFSRLSHGVVVPRTWQTTLPKLRNRRSARLARASAVSQNARRGRAARMSPYAGSGTLLSASGRATAGRTESGVLSSAFRSMTLRQSPAVASLRPDVESADFTPTDRAGVWTRDLRREEQV